MTIRASFHRTRAFFDSLQLLALGQVLAPMAELIGHRVGGLQFEDRVGHSAGLAGRL